MVFSSRAFLVGEGRCGCGTSDGGIKKVRAVFCVVNRGNEGHIAYQKSAFLGYFLTDPAFQ